MAAAATGAATATATAGASSLNTAAAGLGIASAVGNIVSVPFNTYNTMSAAKTEARNAAATAAALSKERIRTLEIFDRESRSLAADQTVSYIMSGVELTSGTPQSVMEMSRAEREADRKAIDENYRIQIENARRAEKAAKKASKNAFLGGMAQAAATIGTAAIVFSDERLKEDLILVGKADNGLNIYLGKYTQESGLDDGKVHLFLIAQEVEKIKPEAVKKHENGFLMVDYAKALL